VRRQQVVFAQGVQRNGALSDGTTDSFAGGGFCGSAGSKSASRKVAKKLTAELILRGFVLPHPPVAVGNRLHEKH